MSAPTAYTVSHFTPATLCCAVLLALGLLCTVPQARAASAAPSLPASGPLDAQKGLALITQLGQNLHILDVRSEEEFAAGHIPDAQLMPVQELAQRVAEVPADKPVLIVCRTGRRAQAAYDYLHTARPQQEQLWYLRAVPEYQANGTYTFR